MAGAASAAVIGAIFVSAQIAAGSAHRPFHTNYEPLLWLSAVATAFTFGLHLGRMRAVLIAAVPAAIAIAVELANAAERHPASSSLVVTMILAIALAAAFGVGARSALRAR